MNDGDILVYKDSNSKKYPELKMFDNFKNNVNKLLKEVKFDFFIPRENNNLNLINHCKTNVLRELGNNDKFVYNFPLLICNVIIIRKSNISIEFLKEWLKACENEEWINGEVYGDMDPQFRWSTRLNSSHSGI